VVVRNGIIKYGSHFLVSWLVLGYKSLINYYGIYLNYLVRVIMKVVENTVEGVRLIISTMVGSGLVVVCLLSNLNLRSQQK
jgi:hypothetical protein